MRRAASSKSRFPAHGAGLRLDHGENDEAGKCKLPVEIILCRSLNWGCL